MPDRNDFGGSGLFRFVDRPGTKARGNDDEASTNFEVRVPIRGGLHTVGITLLETTVAQAELALMAVWQQWLVAPSEADRRVQQALVQQTCQNLAELHNSTSAEQRQRAARRLRAYEQDLRELAGG